MSARLYAVNAAFGLLLGFSLSHIGFSDFGEVHRMFVFADLRLLLTFAGAVALSAVGFFLLGPRPAFAARRIQRGTVAGGVLFGAGWAVCGACPGIVLVQLGEGRLQALLTLGGILGGTFLYQAVQRRRPELQAGESC